MVDKKDGKKKQSGGKKPPPPPIGPVDGNGDAAPTREVGQDQEAQSQRNVSDAAIVKLTRALVRWTAVLAGATIALGVAAFFQYRALDSTDHHIADQVMISRQAMETSNRPWVSVEVLPRSDLTIDAEKRVRLDLSLRMKNFGQSPALNLRWAVRMYSSDLKTVPFDVQRKLCDTKNVESVMPFPIGNIFPEETFRGAILVGLETEDVEMAGKNAVVEDYLYPMVVGCIQYDSSPNLVKYQTGFVFGVTDNRGQPGPDQFGNLISPSKGNVPKMNLRFNFLGTNVN